MKHMKTLLQRIRQTFSPTQGKRGSSLAFVMMVGAALVIWVMCIMPLMATTGETAIKTQVSYDDYLISRSSIEFAKSELEKIVETKLPYTFAITYNETVDASGNEKGTFAAVPKRIGNTPNPDYTALVQSPNALDDKEDKPWDSDAGNTVTAICAVTPGVENPNVYDITITTFHNGKKGLVYKATFTPRGSLLINPEAYKQEQALPLSDFVLVDGKMGPHQVWDSSIRWESEDNPGSALSLGFTETLKPWIAPDSPDWSEFYANSGKYPAVFKTTAHAAYSGNVDIQEPVTMGVLTSGEQWVMPQSEDSSETGYIKYTKVNGKIRIEMLVGTEYVDITEDCTVYLNGNEVSNKSVPSYPGYFQVTVDYVGTDYSNEDNPNKYDSSKVNVLPIDGLDLTGRLSTLLSENANDKHTVPDGCKIEDIKEITHEHKNDKGEVVETTYAYNVILKQPVVDGKPVEGLLYGYASSNDDTDTIHWSSSNVIEGLEKEDGIAYYFYIARPSSYENGIVTEGSDVKEVGMIFEPKFVTSIDNGKYAMFGTKDGKLYALNSGLGVDEVGLNNGFIVSGMDLSAYTWTVGKNNNKYSFKNVGGSYLNISTIPTPQWDNKQITGHNKSIFSDGHDCTKYNCVGCTWAISVNLGEDCSFSLSGPSSDKSFQVSYFDSHDVSYKEYECYPDHDYWKTTKNFTVTAFLNLNGSVSAAEYTENQPLVKFMQMPDAAPENVALPGANYTIADSLPFGTNVLEHVQNAVGSAEVVALYANGQRVTGALNAGEYYMVAKLKVDDVICFVSFGRLRIEKGNLEGNLTIDFETTDTDELRVDVTAEGWHSNGGVRYFGYKEEDETDYHWYTTTGDSYMFRLTYGTYDFAVKESGTKNYIGTESGLSESIEIAWGDVDLSGIHENDFEFTLDPNTGDIVWYSLPEGVLPDRVKLVYGYYWEGKGVYSVYIPNVGWIPLKKEDVTDTQWVEDYRGSTSQFSLSGYYTEFQENNGEAYKGHKLRYYGVIIEETAYGDIDNVFQIGQPINITFSEDGHQDSMMRGSSLYFMGRGHCIDTHNSPIYLDTDLLVLNSSIKGNGSVYVTPYTKDGLSQNTVLLYVANRSGIARGDGTVIFEGRQFYRIPASDAPVDINSISAAQAAEWKIGGVENSTVKYYFRIGMYPEIDLDIAYADAAQLARILSSETMGWTQDGVLSGSNTDSCAAYVVPTYVTSISGDVSHKANRVLIAARANNGTILDTTDDSNTLSVPGSLEFVTRYLSVDADQIVQGNSRASFTIKNLGQDQNFVQWISGLLGIQGYKSKSLQMDYERSTNIIYSDGNINPIPSQICRYEHGANLFDAEDAPIELMARYNTGEIKSLFTNPLGSTVKIVDRYISMECDDGTGVLSVETGFQTKLDIYANYIYIDGSVDKLRVVDKIGNLLVSDITINSQEAGYTEEEYLGLFKYHSAETYTGTLMYFKESVQIETANTSFTVAPGFYYVYAKDNSSSITDLKNLYTGDDPNGNTEKKPVKVELDSLRDYSVWVNPDGTLNDAYVDTGIEDNSSVNLGGFSGGKIE